MSRVDRARRINRQRGDHNTEQTQAVKTEHEYAQTKATKK